MAGAWVRAEAFDYGSSPNRRGTCPEVRRRECATLTGLNGAGVGGPGVSLVPRRPSRAGTRSTPGYEVDRLQRSWGAVWDWSRCFSAAPSEPGGWGGRGFSALTVPSYSYDGPSGPEVEVGG